MATDFFEATQETVRNLNQNERQVYKYVIKNMDMVKNLSIREFAEKQFVSTTTVFRFTRKLGFSGFADFIESLLVTAHSRKNIEIPEVVTGRKYSEEYFKNAMEAIRVMSPKQVEDVVWRLGKKPNIYILTDDNTQTIGHYCERLFIGLGFHAYFPETTYQRQNLVNLISGEDMIIALSYSGEDYELTEFIRRVFLKQHPYLLSITRADNNALDSLSDANFYIFADQIRVPEMDITSSVPMLMIIEMLVYEYIAVSGTFSESNMK